MSLVGFKGKRQWEHITARVLCLTADQLVAIASAQDRRAEDSTDAGTIRLACAEHNLAMAAAAWRRIYDEVQP